MFNPNEQIVRAGSRTWSFSDEHTVSVTLGHRVHFDVDGHIIGLDYLRHPSDNGLHNALVYGPDFSVIGFGAFPLNDLSVVPETARWHRMYFHRRVPVLSGVLYEFAVWFAVAYYAFEHSPLFSTGITVGHITLPQTGESFLANGVFQYGRPGDPLEGNGDGTMYGIDLLFEAVG